MSDIPPTASGFNHPLELRPQPPDWFLPYFAVVTVLAIAAVLVADLPGWAKWILIPVIVSYAYVGYVGLHRAPAVVVRSAKGRWGGVHKVDCTLFNKDIIKQLFRSFIKSNLSLTATRLFWLSHRTKPSVSAPVVVPYHDSDSGPDPESIRQSSPEPISQTDPETPPSDPVSAGTHPTPPPIREINAQKLTLERHFFIGDWSITLLFRDNRNRLIRVWLLKSAVPDMVWRRLKVLLRWPNASAGL